MLYLRSGIMNIAVAQSGGPTCAINSSLAGVIKQAFEEEKIDIVYGSKNGIEGIIGQNLVVCQDVFKTDEDFDILKQTPSSALGSCRFKLPDYKVDEMPYKKIMDCFEKYKIEAFFYIGGNDSMDTIVKLSEYFSAKGSDIRFVGVPKTIDNDLVETDHTPGFGSAAKYVLTTVNEIIRDTNVYVLKSVLIVEIMGRQAGWLTASTSLLRLNGETKPQLIYLPEADFKVEKFVSDIKNELQKDNVVIVAVSEGIEVDEIEQDELSATDGFGHKNLGGIGKRLENIVKSSIGCKVRSVELNVLQRCASHCASLTDITEAENAGKNAVIKMLEGHSGVMVSIKRVSDEPYEVTYDVVDAKMVANNEKPFNKEWITKEQNNVTDDAIKYFLPLIQGEVSTKTQNGIPKHFIIK